MTIRAPGRCRPDALEVARPIAGGQDRTQGDGAWRSVGSGSGSGGPRERGSRHEAVPLASTRAIQRSGASISAGLRQRLGSLPQASQGRRPALLGDGPDELLAFAVLLHLEVHAGDPEHRPLERCPPRPPLVEACGDPLHARHELLPDVIHHVVAEALEQAHHGLCLAEQAALLLAHELLHPVPAVTLAAERAAEPAHRVPAKPARIAPEQRQLSLEATGQVRPQPGMGLEFERVRRLVERDPRPERDQRHVERARRHAHVLLDEQQPTRGDLRGQHGEVVLAEHALAHEPEQDAELARGHPAVGERHRRLGEAAAGRHDLVEELALQAADERGERRRVGADPAGAIDDLRPFDDAGQLRLERRAERGHDPLHGLPVVRLRRPELLDREAAGGAPQAPDRGPLDTGPVHQAAGRGRPAPPAGRGPSPRHPAPSRR